jgi:hypothetical protein
MEEYSLNPHPCQNVLKKLTFFILAFMMAGCKIKSQNLFDLHLVLMTKDFAEIPSSRRYRNEVATSCSQAGLSVKGGGHQPNHRNFNPKFVLPTRYAGIRMEQRNVFKSGFRFSVVLGCPGLEIKEDLRRWKDLPCSWIGRINIVKMAILPKAIQDIFLLTCFLEKMEIGDGEMALQLRRAHTAFAEDSSFVSSTHIRMLTAIHNPSSCMMLGLKAFTTTPSLTNNSYALVTY